MSQQKPSTMNTVILTFSITIRASQQTIFDYVSDWEKQSDWILFTTVKKLSNPVHEKDVTLLATTKFGPIKFVDSMVIAEWQPPEKIIVEHTGRVVLGKGVFTIRELSSTSCQFIWEEITPVPFGRLGKAGLIVIKPFMNLMFNSSLKKLRNNIESF
jgi:hypothetical protein